MPVLPEREHRHTPHLNRRTMPNMHPELPEEHGPTAMSTIVRIKLHGSKAERFEEIKTRMTDRYGFEPANTEVVGHLMAAYSIREDTDE